jgi:SAM-dependent methyltransferase
MGLNHITCLELVKYLPARVLSFGWPSGVERIDMEESTLVALDLVQHDGRERVCDLCEPLPQDLVGQFDVVLDLGTTEHCSNPARVFLNAVEALRVGGVVIQHLPVSMVNHGYWNISPLWYAEFYPANGFETIRFDLTGGGNSWDQHEVLPWPVSPLGREIFPSEALVLYVGRKVMDSPAKLPTLEAKWQRGQFELMLRRMARGTLHLVASAFRDKIKP